MNTGETPTQGMALGVKREWAPRLPQGRTARAHTEGTQPAAKGHVLSDPVSVKCPERQAAGGCQREEKKSGEWPLMGGGVS